ncbi:28S ribosomal protein S22, mitochondrial-like [Amphibalanus amphitrite]|uniref:28S ribosomal protein S22, mitochondrial-like n=1 Tax=Amphibalanus amphitrite TaxID=1232801 RepID=UPI001C923525|nr:28S ribosomal protein S22, mitochondrial-like [Amphibalanus amphitrite]
MAFRRLLSFNHVGNNFCRKYCQGVASRDPSLYFFSSRVQELLFQLNDRQHDLVFKPRKLGQKLDAPQYVFMTDEDLDKERRRIEQCLREKLQVPPVLGPRKPIERVLAKDPRLEGLHDSKLVCIDISPDLSDRKRMITVREPDGTLRTANWHERGRINQIFLPVDGRTVTMPKMFEEPHLTECLDREEYVSVLDRACVQFEPDDPDYIRVTSATYDHVDAARLYERLQSTRHFGALAFYLAWHRRIDNLLLYFIQLEKLDQAVKLIHLYRLLRSAEPISDQTPPTRQESSQSDGFSSSSESGPESESSSSDSDSDSEGVQLDIIRDYIENASVKRPVLELALQNFQHLSAERRRVEREQRRADGRQ